jgi:ABC-type uncharacterized transport system substrate-binding protein
MVLFPPTGYDVMAKAAMTGVVLRIPVVEQFRQFKDIVPDLETVGMLYDAEADPNRIKEISSSSLNFNGTSVFSGGSSGREAKK